MRRLACALLALPLIADAEPLAESSEADAAYDAAVEELALRIEAREPNHRLAQAVATRAASVSASTPEAIRKRLEQLRIEPLRVPGLYYQRHPATGANLAVFETWLGRPVALVPTDEVGSVEHNARRVARAVRSAARDGTRVALFSASKGSADVRAALEGEPELGESVALWLDLVGLLEGTPVTGHRFAAQLSEETDLPRRTARSMSREMRMPKAAPERFPGAVRAAHVAAFPRVANVSPWAQEAFAELRALGPSDGYVLLDQYLRAPGRVLVVRGADHYLRVESLGQQVTALLLVLLDEIAAEAGDPA